MIFSRGGQQKKWQKLQTKKKFDLQMGEKNPFQYGALA